MTTTNVCMHQIGNVKHSGIGPLPHRYVMSRLPVLRLSTGDGRYIMQYFSDGRWAWSTKNTAVAYRGHKRQRVQNGGLLEWSDIPKDMFGSRFLAVTVLQRHQETLHIYVWFSCALKQYKVITSNSCSLLITPTPIR